MEWIRPADLFLLGAFWLLTGLYVWRHGLRNWLAERRVDEWFIDCLNLLFQGAVIPLLQAWVVATLLSEVWPEFAGSLVCEPWVAFLLCFIVVDYGYYWNHRLLHAPALWPLHHTHHSSPRMDVWVTSRNTLWTSLFILYLWVNGLLIYLTGHLEMVVWAATLTAVLDLWRHSGLEPGASLSKMLGVVLITPNDHAWHHARFKYNINYGANFSVWDRLHGTLYRDGKAPEVIGVDPPGNVFRQLIWPYR